MEIMMVFLVNDSGVALNNLEFIPTLGWEGMPMNLIIKPQVEKLCCLI
jgi:hypothetical protein